MRVFKRVREVGRDHFGEKLVAQRGVLQTKDHLDAFVDIALHPIGTAQKYFGVAAVPKDENAAVLEKPADNAAHANVGC